MTHTHVIDVDLDQRINQEPECFPGTVSQPGRGWWWMDRFRRPTDGLRCSAVLGRVRMVWDKLGHTFRWLQNPTESHHNFEEIMSWDILKCGSDFQMTSHHGFPVMDSPLSHQEIAPNGSAPFRRTTIGSLWTATPWRSSVEWPLWLTSPQVMRKSGTWPGKVCWEILRERLLSWLQDVAHKTYLCGYGSLTALSTGYALTEGDPLKRPTYQELLYPGRRLNSTRFRPGICNQNAEKKRLGIVSSFIFMICWKIAFSFFWLVKKNLYLQIRSMIIFQWYQITIFVCTPFSIFSDNRIIAIISLHFIWLNHIKSITLLTYPLAFPSWLLLHYPPQLT